MQTEDLVQRKKRRWRLLLFFFLSGFLTASWSSRIPEIQEALHLDNQHLGTVLSAIPVGLVIGMLLAGRIVARYGPRWVMLVTCIGTALALFLTAITSASLQLMMALFLFGIGRTVFNLAVNTSAVDLQKQYDKPILSTFHGVWSLACLISAGIGTVMIIYGVQPLLHFSIIAVLTSLLALLFIGRRKQGIEPAEKRPLFVKPDRYLFLLGLIALSAMLCESAMFDWSVNYFDKVVHADKKFTTLGYTCFMATMALGRLFGDRLIAFFGVYRMLRINGICMAAGFALSALFPSLLTAALGFLLIGFGDSTLVPLVYMLTSQSTKMASAYALQAVTLIGYTGFLIGPLLIGNVSQVWGMHYAFLLLSGVSLLIILYSFGVKKLAVKA